jgi:glycogen debranching enzyme
MITLKNGNLMCLTGSDGVIDGSGNGSQGLYLEDTRFISKLVLDVQRRWKPLNVEFQEHGVKRWLLIRSSPDAIHYDVLITEQLTPNGNSLLSEITVTNYSQDEAELHIGYDIEYVFEDIFVVRNRNEWLTDDSPKTIKNPSRETITHEKPLQRLTAIDELPAARLRLATKESVTVKGTLKLFNELKKESPLKEVLLDTPPKSYVTRKPSDTISIVETALTDLESLMMPTEFGDFPVAGLPWYANPFGRDSLIFGLQTIRIFPEISKTILKLLAHLQATKTDPFTDSEPGKIIHEARLDELSLERKLPFEMYYGTVDATPLFIMLAGEYLHHTGDGETIRSIEKNLEASANWLLEHGDKDKDSYIEYQASLESGHHSQGWKDSSDSVTFKSGEIASPPIALVEAQGYLYHAYVSMSKVREALGDVVNAREWHSRAAQLKKRFNKDFWLENEQFYALALDHNNDRVDSICSNAGHCLYCEIIDKDKAPLVVKRLFAEDMFTGWGIRTMSSKMPRYNPFSYHNGSVWPHDNAIILKGLLKYGFNEEAQKLAAALLKALRLTPGNRLPELFSGLSEEETDGKLVEYPVSCSPQLWSVGTVFEALETLELLPAEISKPRQQKRKHA